MRDYKDSDGPRWVDVADYGHEVGKAHNGYIRVYYNLDVPTRSPGYMQVYVEYWPKSQEGPKCFTAQKYHYWPHIDFKTMPAMLVKLILDLDFELTQRQVAVETQARF